MKCTKVKDSKWASVVITISGYQIVVKGKVSHFQLSMEIYKNLRKHCG